MEPTTMGTKLEIRLLDSRIIRSHDTCPGEKGNRNLSKVFNAQQNVTGGREKATNHPADYLDNANCRNGVLRSITNGKGRSGIDNGPQPNSNYLERVENFLHSLILHFA
jgi:hypothetical protein